MNNVVCNMSIQPLTQSKYVKPVEINYTLVSADFLVRNLYRRRQVFVNIVCSFVFSVPEWCSEEVGLLGTSARRVKLYTFVLSTYIDVCTYSDFWSLCTYRFKFLQRGCDSFQHYQKSIRLRETIQTTYVTNMFLFFLFCQNFRDAHRG